MRDLDSDRALPTLASTKAGPGQRRFAAIVCLLVGAVTFGLLPASAAPALPMPGFVAIYQSALTVVYGLTTYLFLAQFRRTRSVPLLVLAAGSLYVTLVVFFQLLSFPNVLVQGTVLGQGPDTLIWLWTFWHLGPPVFIGAYACVERGRGLPVLSRRTARWAAPLALGATLLLCAALGLLSTTRWVHVLPKSVEGDDYSLIIWNGTGSGTQVLTVLALGILCVRTRLRTVLQLWLGVSLLLLCFDNILTMAAGARGTVGWVGGRLEALAAGIVVLGVYLREVDFLYGFAEATATARSRQGAALQAARDTLDTALDAAGMGEWVLTVRGAGPRRPAPRHDAIFGHPDGLAEWTTETLLQHVVGEDRAMVGDALAAAERDGRLDVECRIVRADDGATRWVALRGRAERGPDGAVSRIAGVVTDTTDRHAAEERLSQAQRMEALGQLTGGVAHDFNNLLTIIVGNLDMIKRRPAEAQRVERLADSGLEAARRGAALTAKLLAFSRRQVLRPEIVNPNRLLQDFEPLLRRAVGEKVSVRFDLDPGLDPVRLDRGQFENAVLNLAVNARDAMPEGGTLVVATGNATLPADALAELPAGDYVRVAVTDGGDGMDAATAARAFDPFFTTKDVGKGTGLGLSQVYGFVRQAGGQARIRSEEGAGTTVELVFPRSTELARETAPALPFPLRRARAGETVLVVEDEPAVLAMATESLDELGYRTLTAPEAGHALERLRGDERIDILFSDVVMPGGMNGVQLAVEARRLRPGLKVLLTSGYTGAALDEHGVPDDLPLLGKPYMREELAEKLRVVLGRR